MSRRKQSQPQHLAKTSEEDSGAVLSDEAEIDDEEELLLEEELDDAQLESQPPPPTTPPASTNRGSGEGEKLVDLHVCGACEAVFGDVELFVEHKRNGCTGKQRKHQAPRRLLPVGHKSHSSETKATASATSGDKHKHQSHSKPLDPHSKAEPPFDFAPRPSDTPLRTPLGIITDSFVAETSDASKRESPALPTAGNDGDQVVVPPPGPEVPNTLELLQRHTEQALQNTMSGSSFLVNGISGFGNGDFLKFRKDGKEDPNYRHRCRFCGKVFGSDSALQIHIRSHTGERPYKCNVCGNRFSTKGNLKVHFQRHKAKYPHVEMNPNPVPEHLDKFHPPLEPPNGSQSPPPSDSSLSGPQSFAGLGNSPTGLPPTAAALLPGLGGLGQLLASTAAAAAQSGKSSRDKASRKQPPMHLTEQSLALARFAAERAGSVRSPTGDLQPLALSLSTRSYSPNDLSNQSLTISEAGSLPDHLDGKRTTRKHSKDLGGYRDRRRSRDDTPDECTNDADEDRRSERKNSLQSEGNGGVDVKAEAMEEAEDDDEMMSGDESDREDKGTAAIKGELVDEGDADQDEELASKGDGGADAKSGPRHRDRSNREQPDTSDCSTNNSSLGDADSGSHRQPAGFPFLGPNFQPYFNAAAFPNGMAPAAIGGGGLPSSTAAAGPQPPASGRPTSPTQLLTSDPSLYQDLLPKPGSTDNTWESLMEIQKASETSKLQQLVDNIEHKMTDPNQCIICHRVLSCKSALQMHYRTHTGERPFKCKICGRAFTTKGNLKTHMGVHRVKPPLRILHQCPVCHKQFTNALVLQQHVRGHMGESAGLSAVAAEHLLAGAGEIPVQGLPPNFHRPPFPMPFGAPPGFAHLPPGMWPPIGMLHQRPGSADGDRDSLDSDGEHGHGSKEEDEAKLLLDQQDGKRSVRAESDTTSNQGDNGKRARSEGADSVYNETGSNHSSRSCSRASDKSPSREQASSKSPSGSTAGNEQQPPTRQQRSSTSPPNSFSTSLAALENHVKTINSAVQQAPAPPPIPFGGPFGLGLHQLQYQRYVQLAQEQMHPALKQLGEAAAAVADLSKTPTALKGSRSFSPASITSKGTASIDGCDERSSPSGSLPPGSKADDGNSMTSNPASNGGGALELRSKNPLPPPPIALTGEGVQAKLLATASRLSPGIPGALPIPGPFAGLPFPAGRVSTTCQICFKTFACNSALEIHYRSHTKERPFKCEVCDRGFSTKGNMKQHMLTHKIRDLPPSLYTTTTTNPTTPTPTFTGSSSNGSNSSQIAITNGSGGGGGGQKRSASSTPNGSSDNESGKTPVKQSRPSSGGNNSSNSNAGGNLSKHICDVCCKPFSSHSALQIHMRTHTGDKPFKCTVCGRAFTTKGNLKVHYGTHVWNNGSSRRGRRMSIDLPNLHVTPGKSGNGGSGNAGENFPPPGSLPTQLFPPFMPPAFHHLNGMNGGAAQLNLLGQNSSMAMHQFAQMQAKLALEFTQSQQRDNNNGNVGVAAGGAGSGDDSDNDDDDRLSAKSDGEGSAGRRSPGSPRSPLDKAGSGDEDNGSDRSSASGSPRWPYVNCNLCNKSFKQSELLNHIKTHYLEQSSKAAEAADKLASSPAAELTAAR